MSPRHGRRRTGEEGQLDPKHRSSAGSARPTQDESQRALAPAVTAHRVSPISTPHPVATPLAPSPRPCVRGKFVFVGDTKLYIRGVTYGAFAPDADGREYHDLAVIERDFALMAAAGINTVRIPHTMPPRALLDIAAACGLHVMVGLSAEQYIGYWIARRPDAPDIAGVLRAKVRACAGHPALLCYALGNEIPAPMARWLGRRRVERYLRGLYRAVKAEDPDGLVTYVNYPTTEYRGLANARNTGLAAATGEIMAYLDDDAYPDPDWLTYLDATFLRTGYAGVGGPNIAP